MTMIGGNLLELDTPVLWVDLDVMEHNIQRLSNYIKDAGVSWRPHTKGIKIPAIAHKLIDAGAIGITCSKLSEAEVMAAGGIKDILIANEVVGEQKITRLVNIQHHSDVMVAVDDLDNARQISSAAQQAGVKVRVLLELDSGMQRSGLLPGQSAADFVRQLVLLPGLDFAGLMAWEGHVCKINDPQEKKREAEKAVLSLVHTADLCRKEGIEVRIVSCGGTGSFRISSHVPGVTEIQAGGGIFGDLTYKRWGFDMECGLFVLATINSHTIPERAVINAGRKAINSEYSIPEVVDIPEAKLVRFSAEHGVLDLEGKAQFLKVGDKINLYVGYEDLTMFLYDQLIGVRKGKVEIVWDILGRGKLS
jgi:D-serine deaminase-like pyridoxal phosphate-dependent protein